jgi:hypothetical protein
MQYKKVKDDRQMRSLTGLSMPQFEILVQEFSEDYKEWQEEVYQDGVTIGTRHRRPGGGSKGKLPTMTDKLFFTLVYLKTYPTFDVLSTQFNMSRSKSNENIHKLMPVLAQTLIRLGAMPHREFSSAEEMKKAFKGIDKILIDVTERLYRRSQDDKKQREHFSGKKNIMHSKTQ